MIPYSSQKHLRTIRKPSRNCPKKHPKTMFWYRFGIILTFLEFVDGAIRKRAKNVAECCILQRPNVGRGGQIFRNPRILGLDSPPSPRNVAECSILQTSRSARSFSLLHVGALRVIAALELQHEQGSQRRHDVCQHAGLAVLGRRMQVT